jgi:hypothetical protein
MLVMGLVEVVGGAVVVADPERESHCCLFEKVRGAVRSISGAGGEASEDVQAVRVHDLPSQSTWPA